MLRTCSRLHNDSPPFATSNTRLCFKCRGQGDFYAGECKKQPCTELWLSVQLKSSFFAKAISSSPNLFCSRVNIRCNITDPAVVLAERCWCHIMQVCTYKIAPSEKPTDLPGLIIPRSTSDIYRCMSVGTAREKYQKFCLCEKLLYPADALTAPAFTSLLWDEQVLSTAVWRG